MVKDISDTTIDFFSIVKSELNTIAIEQDITSETYGQSVERFKTTVEPVRMLLTK